MTRAVLMAFVGGSMFWLAGIHVHAGSGDQVVTNVQESPAVVRYRSEHYRDPFVPKSVVPNPVRSPLAVPDVNRRTVKVMGTMSSPQGRWAMLEFEDGERLIVVTGQVISAYSRVVKRITEDGVTLAATGEQARPPVEWTYRLYEERDFSEPHAGGDS